MALWRIAGREGVRLASGPVEAGPQALLAPDVTIGGLLAAGARAVADAAAGRLPGTALEAPWSVLAPADGQEVWAAGVTFERSRAARAEESRDADVYDRVYEAE